MVPRWRRGILDFLDHFSIPVEYMVIGLIAGFSGAPLSLLLGMADDAIVFFSGPIGGAIGGYIAGQLRQRRSPGSLHAVRQWLPTEPTARLRR